MKYDLVLLTVYFSVFMQFLTSAIQFDGIFIKLPEEHGILTDILKMETIVQVIEACFYVWLIFNFKNIQKMASKRYYDWVITTPSMLFIFIVYLDFLKNGNNVPNMNDENTTFEYIKNAFENNKDNFLIIIVLNWMMLSFGYMAENKIIDKSVAVFNGFIPFLLYFFIIYEYYAKFTTQGTILWASFVIIWSCYGISELFPYRIKNICYNILDIISKNFFGFFLAIIAYINTN